MPSRHAISSAIGRDQSAYHAASGAAGATFANPANGFTAALNAGKLHLTAGANTWDIALMGLGYGNAIKPVGAAQTSSNGNRVDSNFGPIDQWYINGPDGLEQGFDVAPQADAGGSLTVELALGGDLTATVKSARDGLNLNRPDGSSALGYSGLVANDATGKALPSWLEVRADGDHQDLLIHVDTTGAQGQITIDPFVQEAKLTVGGASDKFGYSVSISGKTVVVGAPPPVVDASGAVGQGAAYLFTEQNTGWADTTHAAKLTSTAGMADDGFGWSVAISGNVVVVGAYGAHSSDSGPRVQGKAYLFV